MSEHDDDHSKQRWEKGGFRINGWRIPYPILAAAVYALMTSSVSLYQIKQLQSDVAKIAPRTEEVNSTVKVLKNRVDNVEDSVRRHNWIDHNNGQRSIYPGGDTGR